MPIAPNQCFGNNRQNRETRKLHVFTQMVDFAFQKHIYRPFIVELPITRKTRLRAVICKQEGQKLIFFAVVEV